MDARTTLRRRVGDTPLLKAPKTAEAIGLPNLRLKTEGANPTGTQKDRIARLEVGEAVRRGAPGVSVGSCGNFGVAVSHAAYVHDVPCHVFIPEEFRGERVKLMEELGATVHRVPGAYEDAVKESRRFAEKEGLFDANPGGANTLRTLAGYSKIAEEIVAQLGRTPDAVGLPIGNGSTLAGVHLGFHTAWAQGRAKGVPRIFGGSSAGNNPVPPAVARQAERVTPLDPRSIEETAVNEPLVNWDALDANACTTAILDSRGNAWGFEDDELLAIHAVLEEDGFDAHPASVAALAALKAAREEGAIDEDAWVVAVMTSGRPQIQVREITQPEDMPAFLAELKEWLGEFGDPLDEMDEAVQTAFDRGHVLLAEDARHRLGYCILTPMELSTFFPKYHLSYIAVDKKARGRGVGTILLEDAVRVAEGDLSLHVETNNQAAIKLYEKFGFDKKYYRMLYKGARAANVDAAAGSGWHEEVDGGTNNKRGKESAKKPTMTAKA